MSLLVIVGVGLTGLASIELRKSNRGSANDAARANARLALMQAIGQLQRTMGPDQRISANAEILGSAVKQPYWVGSWRSTRPDGTSYFERDSKTGNLSDQRRAESWDAASQIIEWLISGSGDPRTPAVAGMVAVSRTNGLADVEVPAVSLIDASGKTTGHLAWWTGDLGVRANIATRDPREGTVANPDSPEDGGLYRIMGSQAADIKMMSGGVDPPAAERNKIASPQTVSLTHDNARWTDIHAFDYTTDSVGVLADVLHGGLKKDLTAYFEQGDLPDFEGLAGISGSTSLVDAGDSSRYTTASPNFGLLRDWARLSVPFSKSPVATRLAELDPASAKESATRALANEQPVKLAGNQQAPLQPILVEASMFTQMSTYLDRTEAVKIYQLRQLMYPRVVLWNPYNCELKTERSMVMIQGNGRQEMWTGNLNINNLKSGFQTQSEWINFEGGRSTSFTSGGGLFGSKGYNDPYMGSYFYSIPATTFGPGECLVFSAAKKAEYDGLSVYRPGGYNLANNELSCEVGPDPAKSYYVSASDLDGGINFLPNEFWYAPTNSVFMNGKFGVSNQADDSRAIWKQASGSSPVTFESFDKLPQISVLSASLQYGGGREPRVAWSKFERMPLQLLTKANPQPTVVPNVRTREGIRLRWFQDTASNLLAGSLAGTSYFDDALLANWNPRASYILRSPWENIGGQAPWFFGAYTRDLFDQAVAWDDQMPIPRNGRYHGNPFGPPQEGNGKYVLFDIPRDVTGVTSIGQLQHAKLSELVWQPMYAIGNSLADPRLGTGGFAGLERTTPAISSASSVKYGGFDFTELGWSADTMRSANKDEWALNARALLGNVPTSDNLVYDLSFELNQTLWDRYFLSTGTSADKAKFAEDPVAHPLPNGRMRWMSPAGRTGQVAAIKDFHKAASQLVVDGAFNVNSTRIEAWKALLGSSRRAGFSDDDNVPFPRVLAPQDGSWKNGDPPFDDAVWSGYRELTEAEISTLAVAIVAEVKLRGPFLSLADFVNRRLVSDETGKMGALQAAIDKAGLNSGLVSSFPLDNSKALPNYSHPDHIPDATRIEQTLKPDSKAWGAPAYLTQADLLQVLGPTLAARSDTFVIRAYGDSTSETGTTRAWCEAVVQRTPQPLDADASGLNPKLAGKPGDYGRRFEITSFRWLSPKEI